MRLIMIIFFSCFSLFAQSITDYPLVDKIEVLIEGDKKSTLMTELPLSIESENKHNISFFLNLIKLEKPIYFIVRMTHTDYIVEIDGKSIEASFINRHSFYTIPSGALVEVKVVVESNALMNEVHLNLLKNDELIPFLLLERIWLGVALGILLAVSIYNGAFFIFNREKSYLYYSLLQVCLFIFMSYSMNAFSLDVESMNNIESWVDLVSSFALIFAILFGQSFLQTKEKTPTLHKILNLFILYYIINIFSDIVLESTFISQFIPTFPVIVLLLYVAWIRILEKFKPAYFYFIGWIIFCIGIIVIELITLHYDYLYILASCFSLEALILSFAISYKVKLIEEDKKEAERVQQEQQQMMLHQSRMAAMGEMVGSIAHQWRQPLTHLSYLMMNLKSAFKHGEMDDTYLSKKSDEASKQIHHMSQTIEDFQNFYNPSKEKDKFLVDKVCRNALQIVEASFKHHHIYTTASFEEGIEYRGFSNELSQALVAILENAKAVFKDRNIDSPKVWITLTCKEKIQIQIKDNAGGIKGLNMTQIFEPFKTTRKSGSGMGLYMARLIVQEHFNGKVEASNTEEGACFTISI